MGLAVVHGIAENRPPLIKESLPKGSEQILLVDDEEDIAAMEKQVLERLGYHVIACTGFSETLTPERIESIGIKGLLMKPIVIKDLVKKLREVFE